MAFDAGSRRSSIHRVTFGRILPTDMVREAFGRDDLDGDRYRSSASQFQIIAQRWAQTATSMHGTAALTQGERNEELSGLIYEEIAPGVKADWPRGRLTIVALQGSATAQREAGRGAGGRSVLLWQDELPAATFSWVPFYSHWRMDDVLGKPFLADLDDDQIHLNQLESMAGEYLRRANNPPLASAGTVNVDTLDYNGDTVFEVDGSATHLGKLEMRYLEYPGRHLGFLENKISRVLDGMYRKGAYQSASRGESKAGESGKAIVALQSADDSILAPLATMTQTEIESFAGLSWKLLKEFNDVGMVINIVGEELAHYAEPYIDRTMLSDSEPAFRLVSGFGTSTEAKVQQLLNLYGMVDSSGEEVLTTKMLRQKWPDQSLFGEQDDPQEYRMRHARVVNQTIERVAEQIRAAYPQLPQEMNHPALLQVAGEGWMHVDRAHPLMMDDDLEAHLNSLTLLTQDDTQDPLARHIAMMRQDQYWEWLAQQQAAMMAQAQPMEGDQGGQPQGGGGHARTAARSAPTDGAASMVQKDRNFSRQVRSM